jgi:hypothetical protein
MGKNIFDTRLQAIMDRSTALAFFWPRSRSIRSHLLHSGNPALLALITALAT